MWNKCNHKTRGESVDPGLETIIETINEKLSKDPNTRVAISQDRQAKPDRKNSGALWFLSLDHYRFHPKGKLPGPSPDEWGYGTKQEKNWTHSWMGSITRKDRFEPMETKEREGSICQAGEIQMNTKMKNQEVHSKCPQEQSHL